MTTLPKMTPSQKNEFQRWFEELLNGRSWSVDLDDGDNVERLKAHLYNSEMDPRDLIVEIRETFEDGSEKVHMQVFGWQGGRKLK